MVIHNCVDNHRRNHAKQSKKDLSVGKCGYYDRVSGNKWVTTHKTNTTEKIKINHQLAARETSEKVQRRQMDYFERKLDDKRRLTIPTELRTEFSSGVVLTRGFGDYLHMYPQAVWDQLVEPELQGSILDESIADLNVRFRRGKTDAELDQKQGRVTVEQQLLDYANISRDVVAVRAGKYWRIQAPELST